MGCMYFRHDLGGVKRGESTDNGAKWDVDPCHSGLRVWSQPFRKRWYDSQVVLQR